MMMKVQYEIVALQVEKMFEEACLITEVSEINNKFNFIREFIEASGWSYSDYTDHMMDWNNKKLS